MPEGEDGADDIVALESGDEEEAIELPAGDDETPETLEEEAVTPVDYDEQVEVRTEDEYQPGPEEVRLEPNEEPDASDEGRDRTNGDAV